MDKNKVKNEKRDRRRKRIRSKVFGTALRPRLAVFRSNINIYAALVDDEARKTIISASSLLPKGVVGGKKSKALLAGEVGGSLAKKALEKNIKRVVFDRSGYVYAGRVKTLADAARKGGLEF